MRRRAGRAGSRHGAWTAIGSSLVVRVEGTPEPDGRVRVDREERPRDAARVVPALDVRAASPPQLGAARGIKGKARDDVGQALRRRAHDGELGGHRRRERPEASRPGEIVPDREFYDYDSKYSDASRTQLLLPAELPPGVEAEVRALGVDAFRAIDACGYARVDFFLERASARLLVNEINTIPGFTSISMFPKLWELSGLSYAALVARLVRLGAERHAARTRLRGSGA